MIIAHLDTLNQARRRIGFDQDKNEDCIWMSFLTLKQLLNRLLTIYKAIGLMHEFTEAMLIPM